MMAIAAALRQGLICGSDLLQALNPSGPVRSGLGSKMGKSPAKWIKSVVFGRKKSSSRSGSTKAKDLQRLSNRKIGTTTVNLKVPALM